LKSYRLTGYLEYSIEKKISYKKVYKGRGRGVYLGLAEKVRGQQEKDN
jgi:hypothetical protein